MQIPFPLQHVLDEGSNPLERHHVRGAVHRCEAELRRIYDAHSLQSPTRPLYGVRDGVLFWNIPLAEANSDEVENSQALEALMEFLISINDIHLRFHSSIPTLYKSGVVYGRTVEWDAIPYLYARQYGDCKSLTAVMVAQLRRRGIPARAVSRFRINEDKSYAFHILILSAQGWHDPSKTLGMGADEVASFMGPQRPGLGPSVHVSGMARR